MDNQRKLRKKSSIASMVKSFLSPRGGAVGDKLGRGLEKRLFPFKISTDSPSSKYIMGELISEGSYGKVYRACHKPKWYSSGLPGAYTLAIKKCKLVRKSESFLGESESQQSEAFSHGSKSFASVQTQQKPRPSKANGFVARGSVVIPRVASFGVNSSVAEDAKPGNKKFSGVRKSMVSGLVARSSMQSLKRFESVQSLNRVESMQSLTRVESFGAASLRRGRSAASIGRTTRPSGASFSGESAYAEDLSYRQQLENEIAIMKRVKSSHYVVRLLKSFEESVDRGDPEIWMVMEYVPLTLYKAVEHNKITRRLTQVISAGVLKGLKHLRNKRVIHRDIKLSNVMISATGYVKLCDFGCAVMLDKGSTHTTVSSIKGTFQYMASELFIEGAEYDHSVDIWSFGQLLYALCFGEPSVKVNGFYTPAYWENYRLGYPQYYRRLLGVAFLYPNELSVIDQKIDMKMYHRRHKAYGSLVPFIRSCLVPYPSDGPKGDIKMENPLTRASIEELESMTFISLLRLSELQQRNLLVNLVQECEDLETFGVDFCSI